MSPALNDGAAGGPPSRFCVYTTMTGGYERLNDQPIARQTDIPFICLTDDENLTSACWTMRLVKPIFPQDAIRSQRDLKLRPNAHLPEFDASLYIDNTVILTAPPEDIFRRHAGKSGLALPVHSFRETVLDEFLEVSLLGFDDQTRIFEQLNHYQLTDPEVLAERPFWAGILLRDHRDPAVTRLLDIWAAHVHRYSRRDQLSFNAACRLSQFAPDAIDVDSSQSWFHRWPVLEGRDRDSGNRALRSSLAPPVARLRTLEKELARETAAHAQTLTSLMETRAALAAARGRTAQAHVPMPGRPALLSRFAARLRSLARR